MQIKQQVMVLKSSSNGNWHGFCWVCVKSGAKLPMFTLQDYLEAADLDKLTKTL